jgi:hypothetical protein
MALSYWSCEQSSKVIEIVPCELPDTTLCPAIIPDNTKTAIIKITDKLCFEISMPSLQAKYQLEKLIKVYNICDIVRIMGCLRVFN